MNISYSLYMHCTAVEGIGNLNTYGISAADPNGKAVSEFPDVSLNKSFTEKIVKLLNECKVKLCHFNDVVIDEINR